MNFLFPFNDIIIGNITEHEDMLSKNISFCENIYNDYVHKQKNNYIVSYTYDTSEEDETSNNSQCSSESDELDYLLNENSDYLLNENVDYLLDENADYLLDENADYLTDSEETDDGLDSFDYSCDSE